MAETTLVLRGSEVRALLDERDAVEAVEGAFAHHGRGLTTMPPKVYLPLEPFGGDFRAMPVFSDGAAGLKWVNAHPHNPERFGLPAVMAVFVLSDPATALPLAVLDATYLTAMRTGAAAAVATKHLARPESRSLGLIGCGAQARTILACHRLVMQLEDVRLCDRNPAAAELLARAFPDLPCRPVELAEAAAADVVCTTTPSRAPVVRAGHVRPGTHLNAMGADAPGKQELDPEILAGARIFLDDREQATESGEVNVPLKQGILRREAIAGTLGEVVAGLLPGRQAADEVTVFDSTGLAVQDLAVARIVYQRARERGLGTPVELIETGKC
ncbi:MAG: ornithine cyclodeaminase family protein [Candidatus Dadabacteria bacterium]|nr:MAG: ornithine cyclodeaminase family protein [Candidatus Dadabacteria bacterium]